MFGLIIPAVCWTSHLVCSLRPWVLCSRQGSQYLPAEAAGSKDLIFQASSGVSRAKPSHHCRGNPQPVGKPRPLAHPSALGCNLCPPAHTSVHQSLLICSADQPELGSAVPSSVAAEVRGAACSSLTDCDCCTVAIRRSDFCQERVLWLSPGFPSCPTNTHSR